MPPKHAFTYIYVQRGDCLTPTEKPTQSQQQFTSNQGATLFFRDKGVRNPLLPCLAQQCPFGPRHCRWSTYQLSGRPGQLPLMSNSICSAVTASTQLSPTARPKIRELLRTRGSRLGSFYRPIAPTARYPQSWCKIQYHGPTNGRSNACTAALPERRACSFMFQ